MSDLLSARMLCAFDNRPRMVRHSRCARPCRRLPERRRSRVQSAQGNQAARTTRGRRRQLRHQGLGADFRPLDVAAVSNASAIPGGASRSPSRSRKNHNGPQLHDTPTLVQKSFEESVLGRRRRHEQQRLLTRSPQSRVGKPLEDAGASAPANPPSAPPRPAGPYGPLGPFRPWERFPCTYPLGGERKHGEVTNMLTGSIGQG
jgi:hypothetical protein